MLSMLLGSWMPSTVLGQAQNRDKTFPTAPVPVRRLRVTGLIPLVMKEIVILSLAALGYSQHAKPYCFRQPHSLPPESNVLQSYPCDAGAFRRALHLLRNIFGVYHDMLRLGPADRWASLQMMVVAVQLVSRLALRGRAYQVLATSFLSQLHRLIPLAYLLAVSYVGVAPSTAGKWYVANQPALDLLANILFPVNTKSECVYGAANVILVTAIWLRYSFLAAGGANTVSTSPAAIDGGVWFPFLKASSSSATLHSVEACSIWAGHSCSAAAATTTAGAAITGSISDSPYHLGTWLPFQLLLSVACTMATLVLERWRGPPSTLSTDDRADDHPQAESSKFGVHSALTDPVASLGVSSVGGSDCSGAAVPEVSSGESSGLQLGGQGDRGTPLQPASPVAAPESTIITGAKQQQQQAVCRPEPAGALSVVPFPRSVLINDHPDFPAALGSTGGSTSETCGGVGYDHGASRPVSSTNTRSDGHDNMYAAQKRPAASSEMASEARAREAALGLAEGEDDGDGELPATQEAGVQRWNTGVHVQSTLGSPSTVGPVGRDAGLTEALMLDLLEGPGLAHTLEVHNLEEEGSSASCGNDLPTWNNGARGIGAPSTGSLTADVTRQDQQQHIMPMVAGMPGSIIFIDAVVATGTAAAGATAVSLLAASGPVAGAETGPHSDVPRRDHEQEYHLLRSLSSQAPQPQERRAPEPHRHVGPHSTVPIQLNLSVSHQPQGDNALSAQHLAQALEQLVEAPAQQQPQQQMMGSVDGPDGGISTAAVVAAVRQARRPAYVPRVRIVTTHIKVQGAQPEQLQSGYTQRLEQVASAAGQRLIGVYVRAGCIELVLDSADWGDAKSSEGSEASFDPSPAQPSGRESGPLPAPLQPRPAAQPPYRSAPSTPSQLQRQRQQRLLAQHLDQLPQPSREQSQSPVVLSLSLQPQVGQSPAFQAQGQVPYEPTVASTGSGSSHNSAALVGLGAIPGHGLRGSAVTGTTRYGCAYAGGGSRGSVQSGVSTAVAGGGNGVGVGIGADLDLGAVIRALRLNRAEGSAESTNDLASELDMDLENGDRVEIATLGLNSGGSGGDASSKEVPISAGGRHGVLNSDAALAAALTSISVPNPTLLQQLQQQQLQQQVFQQQMQDRRHDHVPLHVSALPGLGPQPQPSLQEQAVLINAGSISRQALILGGQRDPLAPGIVSLHPRVFVTAPVSQSAIVAGPVRAATSERSTSAQSIQSSESARGPLFGEACYGGPRDVASTLRLSAVVRRAGGAPLAPSAGAPSMLTYSPSSAVAAEPGFTIRARGEYLPLRVVRMSPVAAAMATSASLVRQGSSQPHGAAFSGIWDVAVSRTASGVGLELGSGAVLSEILGLDEGAQDTSSDMDTDNYCDGQRSVAAWIWHESYILELLVAPQCPGLLLVDLRGNAAGPVPPPCAVPLVAMSDASAAAELQAVVERWEGSPSELDDLLLDLGTWLHHTALPQANPGAAAEREGGPKLDSRLAALGRHLLSYAEVCGWEATAASLRADLAKYGIGADGFGGATGASGVPGSPLDLPPAAAHGYSPETAGITTDPTALEASVVQPTNVRTRESLQRDTVANRRNVAAQLAAEGFTSLRQLVQQGLQRSGSMDAPAGPAKASGSWRDAEAEAREFRTFEHACKSSQIWVMTLLDVVCLLALLFRGRNEALLAPSNVVTLIACCCGAVTAVARLLLPYQRWLHVAEAFKVPRHICYALTKFLIGFAGFPAPPGIAAYELGLPVFVFESVIVPWSCLLSIPTAIAVCAIKLPMYLGLWHRLVWTSFWDEQSGRICALDEQECLRRVGLEHDQAAAMFAMLPFHRRLLRGVTLCALFVSVTAACHASIRVSYMRSRRIRARSTLRSVPLVQGFTELPAAKSSGGPGNAVVPAALPHSKGAKAE